MPYTKDIEDSFGGGIDIVALTGKCFLIRCLGYYLGENLPKIIT